MMLHGRILEFNDMDKPRLLIINASPRKNGNITKRLELMKEDAERKGIYVDFENAQSWNVRPCMGCMKCRS